MKKLYTKISAYKLGQDFYTWFIKCWPHPNCRVSPDKIMSQMTYDNHCFKGFLSDIKYTGHINIRYEDSPNIHKKYYFENGIFTRYKIYSKDGVRIKEDIPNSIKENKEETISMYDFYIPKKLVDAVGVLKYNYSLNTWVSDSGVAIPDSIVKNNRAYFVFDNVELQHFISITSFSKELRGIKLVNKFFGFTKEARFLFSDNEILSGPDAMIYCKIVSHNDKNLNGIYKYSLSPETKDYAIYANNRCIYNNKFSDSDKPRYKVVLW